MKADEHSISFCFQACVQTYMGILYAITKHFHLQKQPVKLSLGS